MNLKHLNLEAIAEARQGVTGEPLAHQLISGAEYSAKRYLVGLGDGDSARLARAEFHVGCLRAEIRKLCDLLAEVVEPMVAEAPGEDSEPAYVEMDWKERRAEHESGVLLARIRGGIVQPVTSSKLGGL